MKGVVVAETKGDLFDLQFGELQVGAGLLYAQLVVVNDGRVGGFLGKQGDEVGDGVAYGVGDVLHGDLPFQVLLHEEDAFLDHIVHLDVLDLAILGEVFDGGKKIGQAEADVFQVLRAVAHTEVLIHLLEQGETILMTAVGGILDRDGFADNGLKETCMVAAEVNPIDAPGINEVGTVDMCLVCRDDKDLVAGEVVAVVATFNPPFAAFAIDEDVFVGTSRALPVVVLGARVIADVGDVELSRDLITCLQLSDIVRGDDCLFPFEAVCYGFHLLYIIMYSSRVEE